MRVNCITEGLSASFSANADKRALRFLRGGRVETALSYADLNADIHRMAACFRDQGIRKGERVVIFLPKSVVFLVAHLALLQIGAISVPVNPGFKQAEMVYLIEDTRPALIVAGITQAEVLTVVNPEPNLLTLDTDKPYAQMDFFRSFDDKLPSIDIQPEDPATIIYTSGTTGQPKGAVLSQANLFHDARNIVDIWQINASDRICHALPLFHVHGLCFAIHTALMAGSEIVMLDRFSPGTVLEALAEKDADSCCTVFMAVPSMYARMMAYLGDKKLDFSHVRLWTSGSAPLLSKDFERIEKVFGNAPVEREGMSETGMNFSNPLNGLRKPGSIGLPLPKLAVNIVSPKTGKILTPGEIGEIRLKSPGITTGYWEKPRETAEAFEDGWFKTGDLGYVDSDGYYYLTDRIKNIIISGGENISPKEVETVINQMEDVLESSVVGIRDETWGEKVVAAIKCRPGAEVSTAEILHHCRQHIHAWKVPKDIKFVDEIPKNRMGKVLTSEVRQFFAA